MARELGVRNLTAFKLESEGTYGTVIPLKNCVSFNAKNNYKDYENYSDCTTEDSSSILQNADVEIEMSSSMGYELLAKLTGAEYVKGKISTVVGGKIPRFALAYEILMNDASTRRRVLYNCNLKKDEQTNETESEGEVWTLTGKALPVDIDGKQYVDTSMALSEIEELEDPDKAKLLAEYNNFFTKVVMPGVPVEA